MQALTHVWNSLVTPGRSAAAPEERRAERLAALLCLCASLISVATIAIRLGTAHPLFLVTDALRTLLVGFASLYLLRVMPRSVGSTPDERRGRITASINLCLILACAVLPWFDQSLYQWPPLAAIYWLLLAAANITPLLLVRAGRVRLAATLLVAQFVIQVVALAPPGNTMLDASEVPTFAITIVAAGLLLRWWAGLLLAPLIPLLHICLAYFGIGPPPDWLSTIVLALLLSVLAALVALHARSLEAAIESADANASRLSSALDNLRLLTDQVRDNRDALQMVVSGIKDGLALTDGEGRVMLANSTLAALCDSSADALVGKNLFDLRPESAEFVARAAAEGEHCGGRFQLQGADGTQRTIEVDCFPAGRAPEGKSRVVLHLTDITERLQLQSLAVQNARLAASGRMAAIVAHEVNSPLQAIQNFLFLAASDNPAERDEYLRLVADEIDRVGELIRRLLELNRPEQGPPREIDVNALVQRVLNLLSGTMSRRRIATTFHAQALPQLLMHPGQLTQVLLNLCLNAVDAMAEGGELRLSTCTRPTHADDALPPEIARVIEIEVVDDGPGIPAELLPHIFDPFVTTKVAGTGLGLAVSRQLIEQQGGRLQADTASGSGARFRVVLPVAPALSATLDSVGERRA